MPPLLKINLLGGLEICQGETAVSGFISHKAPALLAYLVVTPRPHQRDALAALLWGEMSDADAKNNLRQTLSNLRKLLGDHLHITREVVAWQPAVPCMLDVAQFVAHLQAGRDVPPAAKTAAFQQATALYQGDFLAGFVVRDAPEFEEWLLTQRVRYREMAMHALHTLTEQYLAQGAYGRVIDTATRLLALDSWREEAHRQLMLALVHSGQHSAALAQYETCQRVLAKELGVSPSAETTALYHRIRAAREIPSPQLPAQPTPFIGREKELAHLLTLLYKPSPRLLTIVGTGGMGKTRLALQAAECAHQRSFFLQGVYFVPLLGVDSHLGLVTAVATACGLAFAGEQDPTAQLLAFLRERELLLVLDNFEQMADEASWLGELLGYAPHLKLLVTSSEPLQVQWERSVTLEGLALPAAQQLFIDRAQTAAPDFAPTPTTLPILTEICQLVGGMPLAIELAAATIRHYDGHELLEVIRHNLDVLATHFRDMPPRHRSLRAVFNHAWALLPVAEQQLLAALSIFVGSFSLAAAEAIAKATRPQLAALVHKSLLSGEGANGRYQLHPVIRQYAAPKQTPAQQQSLPYAHAAFFAGWLQQQEKALATTAEAAILQAIQDDLPNIRAAWSWALANQHLPLLAQSLRPLRRFYNVQSRFQEGAEWLTQTAAILQPLATATNPSARALYAQLLTRWASFAAWQGQTGQAETLFAEALPLAQQLHDSAELGFLWLNKGYLTMLRGDYETAGQEYAESLRHYRLTEDEHGLADALSALGAWHNVTGDWEEARRYLAESVAIGRQIHDEHGLRSSLTNLGNVYYLLGDYAQAQAHYEEVLPLCQKVGDRAAEAIIQCNLGALAETAGDYTAAERFLQAGIALFEQVNHWPAAVHGQTMLAAVYRHMGQLARSRELLCHALAEAIAKKYDYLLPIALLEIGLWYKAMNNLPEAVTLLCGVVADPTVDAETRLTAEKQLAEWQVSLSPAPQSAVQVTAVLTALQKNS